jgi:phosphoglycolate phosphatase-like HAD superfamily hydrolase
MIQNCKVILWDFDGVLLNSNAIRDSGFEKVLNNFPMDKVAELINFHKANGGLSRYVKFRYFFEDILKQEITTDEINLLAQNFSDIMKPLLNNADLLIQDSLDFVKHQHSLGVEMHIVSGSDEIELRYLCKELGISQYFITINGSPTSKNVIVDNLLKHNNYIREETVLIGDSINDYEAARINRIRFLGYNNVELIEMGDYVKTFKMSFRN